MEPGKRRKRSPHDLAIQTARKRPSLPSQFWPLSTGIHFRGVDILARVVLSPAYPTLTGIITRTLQESQSFRVKTVWGSIRWGRSLNPHPPYLTLSWLPTMFGHDEQSGKRRPSTRSFSLVLDPWLYISSKRRGATVKGRECPCGVLGPARLPSEAYTGSEAQGLPSAHTGSWIPQTGSWPPAPLCPGAPGRIQQTQYEQRPEWSLCSAGFPGSVLGTLRPPCA